MFGICLPNYYICNRNEKKIKQVNINLTIFKEMNKKLFFLAIAALGLAACSNDDVVEINQSLSDANAISFRSDVGGQTRATATTTETIQTNGFFVGAWNHTDSHTSYFADELFTKDETPATTYHSSAGTTHFWPATGSLDFVAYYPNVGGQLTHGAWNTFTLVPSNTNTEHVDYVIAATFERSKVGSADGVPMKFKHLGSWIELKTYNSKGNATGNMKTTVQAWKVGYIHKGGVYTVSSNTTTESGLSSSGSWDYSSYPVQSSNVPNEYKETLAADVTTTTNGACDTSGEAVATGNAMIVVPQSTTKKTGESKYTTGGYLTCAFIAVKLLITDGSDHTIANATGTTNVDEIARDLWAVWPISNDLVDGYKYTYTIDLAQGGYKEIGTPNGPFEPWLAGAEIFFDDVEVTSWSNPNGSFVWP